jgi:steroid 5-alpha reductase family enzyme
MTMSPISAVLLGWLLMAVIMLVLWISQYVRKDAGIVDVGWAAGLGILAILYSVLADGLPMRRALVGALVAIWYFRLAGYLLFNRVIGKEEDGRYQTLRRNWAGREQKFFFVFFQAQGLLDVILSLCYVGIMYNPAPVLNAWEYAGAAVWIIAVLGESLADRQLARHRADPLNRGKTCRVGLWRYSRHPNYFFEWLSWWAYVLMGIALPYGWLTLIGPALMLYLIFRITGIPPTEAQALSTRGDDYRDYQRTTSSFIPWFRRGASAR